MSGGHRTVTTLMNSAYCYLNNIIKKSIRILKVAFCLALIVT